MIIRRRKKRSLHVGRDPGGETRLGKFLYPETVPPMPATRGGCAAISRPCPFVRCRHHLYADVSIAGTIRLNHPGVEVWDMRQSCSLDVADEGPHCLEDIGELLGLTRERIRQVEVALFEALQADVLPKDFDVDLGPARDAVRRGEVQ